MATFTARGTCDVCQQEIVTEIDPMMIDYAFDGDTVITWVRHYATAPADADPRCAVYSSVVRFDQIPFAE